MQSRFGGLRLWHLRQCHPVRRLIKPPQWLQPAMRLWGIRCDVDVSVLADLTNDEVAALGRHLLCDRRPMRHCSHGSEVAHRTRTGQPGTTLKSDGAGCGDVRSGCSGYVPAAYCAAVISSTRPPASNCGSTVDAGSHVATSSLTARTIRPSRSLGAIAAGAIQVTVPVAAFGCPQAASSWSRTDSYRSAEDVRKYLIRLSSPTWFSASRVKQFPGPWKSRGCTEAPRRRSPRRTPRPPGEYRSAMDGSRHTT